jgi:hypothetical protein
MSAQESAEYLAHHLKLASREDRLFSDNAVALLHERKGRHLHSALRVHGIGSGPSINHVPLPYSFYI